MNNPPLRPVESDYHFFKMAGKIIKKFLFLFLLRQDYAAEPILRYVKEVTPCVDTTKDMLGNSRPSNITSNVYSIQINPYWISK